MNTSQLVSEISARTLVPHDVVKQILEAQAQIVYERLGHLDYVVIHGLLKIEPKQLLSGRWGVRAMVKRKVDRCVGTALIMEKDGEKG